MYNSYYRNCYPCVDVIEWVGASYQTVEWAMELSNDVFIRYLQMKDADTLRKQLNTHGPLKVHIGPSYNMNPSLHDRVSDVHFQWTGHHLVFDVDVDDYPDRPCCKEKQKVCRQCWPLLAACIKIIDRGLREDFGFKQVLWVFSGRRGVHCWVSDDRVKKMNSFTRAGICKYFSAELPTYASHVHPVIRNSVRVARVDFLEYVKCPQSIFAGVSGYNHLLSFLPYQSDKSKMLPLSDSDIARLETSPEQAWYIFSTRYKLQCAKEKLKKKETEGPWQTLLQRIIWNTIRPRLDEAVTADINHLLKAPFSVHPGTQKICVPIDPAAASEFDPDAVPTADAILDSVGICTRESSAMKDYIKLFNRITMTGPCKLSTITEGKEKEEEVDEKGQALKPEGGDLSW